MTARTHHITSPDNPRIRAARALARPAERVRTGHFFVEGTRFLHRLLDSPHDIEHAIVAPDLLVAHERRLVGRIRATGVPVVEVSPRVFGTLSRSLEPTGLGAVVRQRWRSSPGAVPGLWAAAAGIQAPGNLGTIIRTCEAAGAGLFVVGGSADPHDPAALRASMGAVFGVTLVRSGWRELVGWCRRTNTPLMGTSPSGALCYRAGDLSGDVVVAFGSEPAGLTEEQIRDCDDVLTIPMPGRIDSLNVGVAAGIVLFEAVHQREAVSSASAEARQRLTNAALAAM